MKYFSEDREDSEEAGGVSWAESDSCSPKFCWREYLEVGDVYLL